MNNPKKYSFSPIDLLADLVMIYTNLAEIELFIKAVAGDDMFQLANVQKAFRILRKSNKHEEAIRLNDFISKITEVTQNKETNEEEQWLEEAPEDFLCPIAY